MSGISICEQQAFRDDKCLKEYSVILIAPFYGINQKTLTKKLISKISVDSDFLSTLLCALATGLNKFSELSLKMALIS